MDWGIVIEIIKIKNIVADLKAKSHRKTPKCY